MQLWELTKMEDITNSELDDEKPSSIKDGFQRWLIVAGLIITFLFIYLFMSMRAEEAEKEKERENKETVDVPKQVQEGTSNSLAVDKFKKTIKGNNAEFGYGEKVKTESVNEPYAPQKTVSYARSKERSEKALNKEVESKEKTPYQKFLESEQMRAYKSMTSKDTIGDSSGFYEKQAETNKETSKSKPFKRESLEVRQRKIRDQITAISEYRKAIERGDIDPSSPPPKFMKMLEGMK